MSEFRLALGLGTCTMRYQAGRALAYPVHSSQSHRIGWVHVDIAQRGRCFCETFVLKTEFICVGTTP